MRSQPLPVSQRIKAVVDMPVKWRHRVDREVPPFRIYGVYRHTNADLVLDLVGERSSKMVHLWALDRPHPSLAAMTCGAGPGGKFDLIDRLFQLAPAAVNEYVVLIEDDVSFVRGGLDLLVTLTDAAGLELAQASHDRRGFVNYGLTVSQPLTRARRTTFVEIGPILVISPDRVGDILPAGGAGMGYGLERYWYNLEPTPTMGVVDEVRLRHLKPTGRDYDQSAALREMAALWDRRKVLRPQPQLNLARWWAWQGKPSWSRMSG